MSIRWSYWCWCSCWLRPCFIHYWENFHSQSHPKSSWSWSKIHNGCHIRHKLDWISCQIWNCWILVSSPLTIYSNYFFHLSHLWRCYSSTFSRPLPTLSHDFSPKLWDILQQKICRILQLRTLWLSCFLKPHDGWISSIQLYDFDGVK